MKSLLIGGTGFIGSALARGLLQAGEEVISVSREQGESKKGLEHLQLDLENQNIPKKAIKESGDVFILIGQISPNFDRNREKNLLEKVVKPFHTGNQRIFYFSSALVYGECSKRADEQTPCQPIGDYPSFKLESESIVGRLIPAGRLVIPRLANVYGSIKNRGFISTLINQAMTQENNHPVTLNSNGTPRRDYVFIDDVVEALLAIKKQPSKGGVVNIATGISHSLKDVVETFDRIAPGRLTYELSNNRPNEPQAVILSNKRLKKDFGYEAFMPLEEGLTKTIERFQVGQ